MGETSYFFTADHERELDLLQHAIDNSSDLLLLTGETGVGKSHLLQVLIERLITSKDIIRLDASSFNNLVDFYSTFASTVGFDDSQVKPDEWSIALQYHLIKNYPDDSPLIVIDGADDADDELLEAMMLLNSLKNEEQPLVRIIISGNLTLKNRVDAHPELSKKTKVIELFRYEEEQMSDFIDYLIQRPDSPFPERLSYDQKQSLIDKADGLPGNLILLIDGSTYKNDSRRKLLFVAVGILALIVLVVLFFFFSADKEDMSVETIALPAVRTPDIPKRVVLDTPPEKELKASPSIQKDEPEPVVVQRRLVERSLAIEKVDPDRFKSPDTKLVTLFGEGFNDQSKVILLMEGDDQMIELKVTSTNDSELTFNPGKLFQGLYYVQVVNEDGSSTSPLTFNVEGEKAPAKALVNNEKSDVSKPVPKPVISLKPKQSEPEKVEKAAPAKIVTAQKLGSTIHSAQWYEKQQKSAYVLQLYATSSRVNLDMMTTVLSEKSNNFATFAQVKDGNVIHVVTEGLYKTKEAANRAAKRFKPEVEPWPRTIESVLSVMTTRGELVSNPVQITTVSQPKPANGVHDVAWIWSQDPTQITIQIAASSTQLSLEKLAQEHRNLKPLAIYNTERNGEPWFILVNGRYQSREEARSAIKNLPQVIQKKGPWVRSFASIHDALSK